MNNADQPTEEVVGNREDTRNCNRAAETTRTGVSAASRYKKKSKRKLPHQQARQRHGRKQRARHGRPPKAERGIQLSAAPEWQSEFKQKTIRGLRQCAIRSKALQETQRGYQKATRRLRQTIEARHRWVELTTGLLMRRKDQPGEVLMRLWDVRAQAFHLAATEASIARLTDVFSEGTGSIFDSRSRQRREIEAMKPVSINTLYTDHRRHNPGIWADTRPGGGRDGLMQDAANREQADMTARSHLLAQPIPTELQGPAAHSGTRALTSTGVAECTRQQYTGPKLRTAEICAGACATTSVAEERSGFFSPAILCERDVQAKTYLKKRYPEALIVPEVWELTPAMLDAHDVKVVHASTPCTAFSRAGNQQGLKENDANAIFHVLHLVKNMDQGRGAVMFSYENVREITQHVHKEDFEKFITTMLPAHHVSIGHVQAATTANPYDHDGAALVSHARLWIFAVRKDLFEAPLEVSDLPQCPPATSCAHVMEQDGERSPAYHILPAQDQHFLVRTNRKANASTVPYYISHEIADAPKNSIGTGIFPTKVVDLSRGVGPTLTSHSWPWILDVIAGVSLMRQITHVEAQRWYGLTMEWAGQAPALDDVFWRRQISQCVPQCVANARTHAFHQALVRRDAAGCTPLERLQQQKWLIPSPPPSVASAVASIFTDPARGPAPPTTATSPAWEPRLDLLELQNSAYRGQRICARHQLGHCHDPQCEQAHVCHICMVAHPGECPEAQAWQKGHPQGPLNEMNPALTRIKEICLPGGVCDPELCQYAEAFVQQLNCVSTSAAGLTMEVERRWPHAVPYRRRRPQDRLHRYARPEDWTKPGTMHVHHGRRNGEPTILNLFAQFDMHRPGRRRAIHYPPGVYDTARQREQWFWQGLQRITQMPEKPASIAFPHRIGCTFAGGHWPQYKALIERFADQNPQIDVYLVTHGEQQRQSHGPIHAGCITTEELPESYWRTDPKSCIFWQCSHGAVQIRGHATTSPEGYFMDEDETIPMPRCTRPSCIRYGNRQYDKLRPFLAEPYWPQEEHAVSLGAAALQMNSAKLNESAPRCHVEATQAPSDEEIQYRKLVTDNLTAILDDPRGARCVHCFGTPRFAGDLVDPSQTTAMCPECAHHSVVPVSQVPGVLLPTLRRWRRLGFDKVFRTIPGQRWSWREGISEEYSQDQKFSNAPECERCIIHHKNRSLRSLIYDEEKCGYVCKPEFECKGGSNAPAPTQTVSHADEGSAQLDPSSAMHEHGPKACHTSDEGNMDQAEKSFFFEALPKRPRRRTITELGPSQVACVTVAQELQVEESQVRDLAASCIDAGLIDASLDRNNGVITFVHASHRLTTYAQWKLLREHHQRLEELMRVALDRHVAREPWDPPWESLPIVEAAARLRRADLPPRVKHHRLELHLAVRFADLIKTGRRNEMTHLLMQYPTPTVDNARSNTAPNSPTAPQDTAHPDLSLAAAAITTRNSLSSRSSQPAQEGTQDYDKSSEESVQTDLGSLEQQTLHDKYRCRLFRCELVADATPWRCEFLPLGTQTKVRARLRNNGPRAWPSDTCLRFLCGSKPQRHIRRQLGVVQPGEHIEVDIPVMVTKGPGLHSTAYHVSARSASGIIGEMRIQTEVFPDKRVSIQLDSDRGHLHQRIVAAYVQAIESADTESEEEEWEELAQEEQAHHRCERCMYHPTIKEDEDTASTEVQVCDNIERSGKPSIETFEQHRDQENLRPFIIDRYACLEAPLGHIWIPVPQGDEPTEPARLPLNRWASRHLKRKVYGPALLVRRQDLDYLRQLEAKHDDMHLSATQLYPAASDQKAPRILPLARQPLRSRAQKVRDQTRASEHCEECAGCREARNLSLADYHRTRAKGSSPKPTHAHCHQCGDIYQLADSTHCPACDDPLTARKRQVWNSALTTPLDSTDPQLSPVEEGERPNAQDHRKDAMILPCTLRLEANGQWTPHVAIHRSDDGAFHPIGGKVGDQEWCQGETLSMAIKREMLEEATDDETMAGAMEQCARWAKPSLAWYVAPCGTMVQGSIWSVVTDRPISLTCKEPGKHHSTVYAPVAEVFMDQDKWARPSLFRAAKHEVQRALLARSSGQAEQRWRGALAPSAPITAAVEASEGVLLQADDNALQASVLVAQSCGPQGPQLCCPINTDLRAGEAAAILNREDSRLMELPRVVELDARMTPDDQRRQVWGGMLTAQAALELPQWTKDSESYKVRAVPLLEFLSSDPQWRKQWREPLQLLRMQIAALEVYFAAMAGDKLPRPKKEHQTTLLRYKEQAEEWKARHCWDVEEAEAAAKISCLSDNGERRKPMFSWLNRYPLADARTRRKITLSKGINMVTLAFTDLFGSTYETPRSEDEATGYWLETHPVALAQGSITVIGTAVSPGLSQAEVYIQNNSNRPLTIATNTPLAAITERSEVQRPPESNYLVHNHATNLKAQHQLDLTQHEMEETHQNVELRARVSAAILHAAKNIGRELEVQGPGNKRAEVEDLARRLSAWEPDSPPESWDKLTQVILTMAPSIAHGDNQAARQAAIELHIHEESQHGIPRHVLWSEAAAYFKHSTLNTPSWRGRHIAWAHAFQEPQNREEEAALKQEVERLAERASREEPASLVVLNQAGGRGEAAMQVLRRQGFQEINLPRKNRAHFETDRHLGRRRHKRTKDAQGELRVMWYQPSKPGQDGVHNAISAQQPSTLSDAEAAALTRKITALAEADPTLKAEERQEIVERTCRAVQAQIQEGKLQLVDDDGMRQHLLQSKDGLEMEREDQEMLAQAKKTLANDGLMTEAQKEQMLEELKPHLRHTLNPKNLGRTSQFGKFHLDTGDAKPVRSIPWRVSPMERDIIRAEIRKMLDLKVIRPSNSPWSTQVVVVKKKDGTHRMAIDYRGLNRVTKFDASPIPRVDDSIAALQGKRYFSLADLNSGFWQLEVDEESIPKTAFSTGDAAYEFLTMPMGLSTASQAWQRLMNQLVQGHLQEFCLCYIDDLIVFSDNFDDHLIHVRKTLRRFAEAGLTLKLRKCLWAAGEVAFLGHIVGGDKIRPSPEKTAAIRAFRRPRNIKQVRAFLGLCGWYRRFIANYTLIAAPLIALTKKENHALIEARMEDEDCIRAFTGLQDALCHADLMLLQPDHSKDFRVETDACDYQLGAVLTQQDEEGNWRPVEFWSRRLTQAEYNQRQTPTYLEAIAIFEATTRWRHFLISRPFSVVSDHQALVSLPTRKSATDRLTRIQLSLQDFNYQILYRQGEDNVVPDALSRIDTEETGEGPDPADVHQVFPERTLADSYRRWQGHQLFETPAPTGTPSEHVLEMTVDLTKGKHSPTDTDRWKFTPAPGAAHTTAPQVHNAALTRSVASRLQAAAAEGAVPEEATLPTKENHIGRFVRKRFGPTWYLGKVTAYIPGAAFVDALPGFRVHYEADGDMEELNEEELNAVLLDENPARWPNPLLVATGQTPGMDTPEPARWSWPCESTDPREEAERRLITPCRIMPGYEPPADTESPESHRYLALPNDEELLKLQQDDTWCKEVVELLATLRKPELSKEEETRTTRELIKHELPKAELKQWFVEPSTGLLMREGFVRTQIKRKRDIVKAKKLKKKGDLTEAPPAMETKRVVPQRVIPAALRAEMLYAYHGHITAGHKGVNRVREAMARTVWWPKITRDITLHIQSCHCPKGYRELRQERPRLVKSLLQESQGFGQHISIDCSGAGPLTRHGNKIFMVIVDTFSLYTCVVALPAANAEEVARALIQHWITYFGMPVTIHSDSGPEFHNALLTNIARQLQVHTTRISPYNPSGNTFAENAVKKTKRQVTELVGGYYDTWDEYVSLVSWTYNASLNERTGAIPMTVAFGQLPRGIIDLALPPLQPERDRDGRPRTEWTNYRTGIMDVIQRSNEWVHQQNEEVVREKKHADQELKKGYEVKTGDTVWMYNPHLRTRKKKDAQYHNYWTGPYLVHAVSHTQNTATLQVDGGRRLRSVNVRHLRKYQSPLMAAYGGDPRMLAAIPVGVLAFREQKEEDTTKFEYLVRLHSDASFQDWVAADLLPRSMVLEYWRLMDSNPYLKGFTSHQEVAVMLPDRGARLHKGTIQHRTHNLLHVLTEGGEEVLAYITPIGTVRSAERTTEAARREQDHTHSREAAPEDFAESGAPAEPEELIDEPSHPTGAVAPEAVRITRSGRAGLQVSATHMQPTTQKNGDMERQQHPAARRILSCKGTEARDSPGHTTTVWCPNVAHLAFRDLSTYRHRDERHPRKLATVVTSRRHWHPPWDALVEAEEITESNTPEHEMCAQWWCLAITATATVTM